MDTSVGARNPTVLPGPDQQEGEQGTVTNAPGGTCLEASWVPKERHRGCACLRAQPVSPASAQPALVPSTPLHMPPSQGQNLRPGGRRVDSSAEQAGGARGVGSSHSLGPGHRTAKQAGPGPLHHASATQNSRTPRPTASLCRCHVHHRHRGLRSGLSQLCFWQQTLATAQAPRRREWPESGRAPAMGPGEELHNRTRIPGCILSENENDRMIITVYVSLKEGRNIQTELCFLQGH